MKFVKIIDFLPILNELSPSLSDTLSLSFKLLASLDLHESVLRSLRNFRSEISSSESLSTSTSLFRIGSATRGGTAFP